MRRSVQTYLSEIQRAAEYLLTATNGLDFDAYSSDRTLMFPVERNFEIIGEAMNGLRRHHSPVDPRLDAPQAIGFRNFIAHQYWSVDHGSLVYVAF